MSLRNGLCVANVVGGSGGEGSGVVWSGVEGR